MEANILSSIQKPPMVTNITINASLSIELVFNFVLLLMFTIIAYRIELLLLHLTRHRVLPHTSLGFYFSACPYFTLLSTYMDTKTSSPHSINAEKSRQTEDRDGVGTGGTAGPGHGEGIRPGTRRRVKYNKYGEELTGEIGTRFPKDLYQEYKDRAYFRKLNLRDLIRDAMMAYLPELKKSHTQKLREAGQADLIS